MRDNLGLSMTLNKSYDGGASGGAGDDDDDPSGSDARTACGSRRSTRG